MVYSFIKHASVHCMPMIIHRHVNLKYTSHAIYWIKQMNKQLHNIVFLFPCYVLLLDVYLRITAWAISKMILLETLTR